ncbi:MAG: hypothetical protein PVF46_01470, partial [Lysobacterales bacterium]
MKRFATVLLVLGAVAATVLFLTRPRPVDISTLAAYEADSVNGERLFHAGGCVSCHGSEADDT